MDRRRMMLSLGAAGGALAAGAPAWADTFASNRITVETLGTGPDVVLIHGLSSHRDVWKSTVEAVPGYRYHLVQMAGMGGVPAGGNAQGPVAVPVAEDIARYIRDSGLSRPAVIGHSMGGAIALMLAARHPELVGKVMVVDMLPFMGAMFGPPPMTSDKARPMADQIRGLMLNAPQSMYDQQLIETVGSMVKDETLRPRAIADSRRSDRTVAANAFHELVVTDLRAELATITAPVTVLYVTPNGSPLNDQQMDAAYAASYAGLKGARLVRIPDAWHFIMWDQPARFQTEMKAFLAG